MLKAGIWQELYIAKELCNTILGAIQMTIKQAMKFIYGTTWKGSILGLSRITELMRLLGEPHKKLKFVHVAGTNGKGSTSAMLASILAQAGYKTGLYTSPYLYNFNELIQINNTPITDGEIIQLVTEMQRHKMHDMPTEYEIITALAFLHFWRGQCDIVVLEVGMGGRLDSTNIIETPEAAIITAIGLDHMGQLGDTIEKIAGEKAGIIKPNGNVVCHEQPQAVEAIIRRKCEETGSKVVFAGRGGISLLQVGLDGQMFSYDGKSLVTPLLGEHQLKNTAVVLEAVEVLRNRGWQITDDHIKDGLRNTTWRGRFEVIRREPVFIIDVAHNPQGVRATLGGLQQLFPDRKVIFIFGVLADKDYAQMAELLLPYGKKFILVTPENPRALPAAKLREFFPQGEVCETVSQGVALALEYAGDNDIICSLGSLSLIGTIRKILV